MSRRILLCFVLFIISIYGRAEDSGVKEMFIEAKKAKLFCRTMGKGNPLIVVHGGPGLTQDYLLPEMGKLAENNFVIFYDQRGCGQSTGEISDETITMDTFVDDLDVIRKAYNIEKVSILGQSWGGLLAMEYAIAYPEHVDKLILSNTIPASSQEFYLFIQEWIRRTAPYQAEIVKIRDMPGFQNGDPDTVEQYYRIVFRTYCYNPEKANLLNVRMTATASVNGSKVHENLRKNVFENPFDLYSLLNELRVPTLVIHGDTDIVPVITAQKIHDNIPNSEYIVIKNCGHFPWVESPDEFFNSIKGFLE